MYLLDTNICIDFIDGRSAAARRRINANRPAGLHVSAVSAGELLVGPKTSESPEDDRLRVERFLSVMTVHDFDGTAASRYGEIVRKIGIDQRSFDRLIAAHALALRLVLVTNNEIDFADVPGLKVENWTV